MVRRINECAFRLYAASRSCRPVDAFITRCRPRSTQLPNFQSLRLATRRASPSRFRRRRFLSPPSAGPVSARDKTRPRALSANQRNSTWRFPDGLTFCANHPRKTGMRNRRSPLEGTCGHSDCCQADTQQTRSSRGARRAHVNLPPLAQTVSSHRKDGVSCRFRLHFCVRSTGANDFTGLKPPRHKPEGAGGFDNGLYGTGNGSNNN
jgi:hypothetical protein